MTFKCKVDDHPPWQTIPAYIKNGYSWCTLCTDHTQKYYQEIDRIVTEQGGTVLSEYIDADTNMTFKCGVKEHPSWEAAPTRIKWNHNWCPLCKNVQKDNKDKERRQYYQQQIEDMLKDMGGTVLSNYINTDTNMTFKCKVKEHPPWETTPDRIKAKNSWCSLCLDLKKQGIRDQYHMEIEKIITDRGGTVLSKYEGSDKKMTFKCAFPDHPSWETTPGSIKAKQSWCYSCSKTNISEEICKYVFSEAFGASFDRTRKEIFMHGLELDGFCPEFMVAFEFNGEQHYKRIALYHPTEQDFTAQQERDKLKIKYCAEAGVDLIVVPYTVKMLELRTYIRDALDKIGKWDLLPPVGTHAELCDKVRAFGPDEVKYYNEIKKIVEESTPPKGKVISERYMGSLIKMRFKCHVPEHPEFLMLPYCVRDNEWCIKCGHDRRKKLLQTSDEELQRRLDECNWVLLGTEYHVYPGGVKRRRMSFRRCSNETHRIYTMDIISLKNHIKIASSTKCPDCVKEK